MKIRFPRKEPSLWRKGILKTDLFGWAFQGETLYFRKHPYPFSYGPVWIVVNQGRKSIRLLSESFAGPDLTYVVRHSQAVPAWENPPSHLISLVETPRKSGFGQKSFENKGLPP